jgi:REP element-mobilizing transposase RayT
MTYPRSSLICLDDTPWYHCVSRCVRRAFLCGADFSSGKDYEYRRGWIVNRMKELANIFAVDIAAYVVMSNHYHLVVRVAAERAKLWSMEEVLRRWSRLFAGPALMRQFLRDGSAHLSETQLSELQSLAEGIRFRLYDLSWFTRVLNESIARMANDEDDCRGRFWEGRFRSQALLDRAALLSAMVYVELNPVRAGMVDLPEAAPHTSLYERLASTTPAQVSATPLAPLMPFDPTGNIATAIPFTFLDYVELVDWTGRQSRPEKRGKINDNHPPILARTGLNPEAFIEMADNLLKNFGRAVGTPERLASLCGRHDLKYIRGIETAHKIFNRTTS